MAKSEQFLSICADEIVKSILEEIKSVHSYGIIVDGTQDVSHSEYFVFIIKYVFCLNGKWK